MRYYFAVLVFLCSSLGLTVESRANGAAYAPLLSCMTADEANLNFTLNIDLEIYDFLVGPPSTEGYTSDHGMLQFSHGWILTGVELNWTNSGRIVPTKATYSGLTVNEEGESIAMTVDANFKRAKELEDEADQDIPALHRYRANVTIRKADATNREQLKKKITYTCKIIPTSPWLKIQGLDDGFGN